jgi:hypothetical protein
LVPRTLDWRRELVNPKHLHALMCALEDMLEEVKIRVHKGESLEDVICDLKWSVLACQETLMEMRS